MAKFVLSKTLKGHEASVRTLSITPTNILFSGSFDGFSIIWKFNEESKTYQIYKNLKFHDELIFASCCLAENLGFCSGGKDQKLVFLDFEGNEISTIPGFNASISSISQFSKNEILVGCWDGNAYLWDLEKLQLKSTLAGHSHAVATLAMPNNLYITGSQNGKINIWKNSQLSATLNAHTDLVRKIIPLSNGSFASCSNDGLIKIFDQNGSFIKDFVGHSGYVFSLAELNSGILVSASDDRTIKIWDESVQSIIHSNSVWDICANPKGDLISGCGDNFVRVFTTDESRMGTIMELEEFKLAGEKEPSSGGNVDVSYLPDISELKKFKGQKIGAIKLFKENGIAIAFEWKGQSWERIGEVMMNKKYYPGDKIFPEGEYDHLFDIEVDSGGTKVLPFNDGDNPYLAADKFAAREHMSKVYVEQIYRFLKENSRKAGPKDKQIQKNIPPIKSAPIINSNIIYDTMNADGALKKILEYNQIFKEKEELKIHAMNANEVSEIESLFSIIKDKNKYILCKISELVIQFINKKLLNWPKEYLLPIIDSYKIMILLPPFQSFLGNFNLARQCLLKIINNIEENTQETLLSVTFKCLCNWFEGNTIRVVVSEHIELILKRIIPILPGIKAKSTKESIASFLLNVSIALNIKHSKDLAELAVKICCIIANSDSNLSVLSIILSSLNNIATNFGLLHELNLEWAHIESSCIGEEGEKIKLLIDLLKKK